MTFLCCKQYFTFGIAHREATEDFKNILEDLLDEPNIDIRPPVKTSTTDQTMIGPQFLKLIDFVDEELTIFKQHLEDNEKKDKKGFLYLLGDIYESFAVKRALSGQPRRNKNDADLNSFINFIDQAFWVSYAEEQAKRNLNGLVETSEAQKIVAESSNLSNDQQKKFEEEIKSFLSQIENNDQESQNNLQTDTSDQSEDINIDETKDFLQLVSILSRELPFPLNDKDIKSFSYDVISEFEKTLNEIDYEIPNKLAVDLNDFVSKMKHLIDVTNNLSTEQMKLLFYAIHNKLNLLLDSLSSSKWEAKIKKPLENLSLKLWDLQEILNKRLPNYAPLKIEFNQFIDVLKKKIFETNQVMNLDRSQIDNLLRHSKDHINQEFNDIDYDLINERLKSLASDLNDTIVKRLKNSFSEINLQNIIYGLTNAARVDSKMLIDRESPSGFVFNSENISKIEAQFIQKVKSILFDGQKVLVALPAEGLNIALVKLTQILNDAYKPGSLGHPKDEAILFNDVLAIEGIVENYEKSVFETLSSEEFRMALSKYFRSFFKAIQDLNKRIGIDDLLQKSQIIKQVKNDIGVAEDRHHWFVGLFKNIFKKNFHLMGTTDVKICKRVLTKFSELFVLKYSEKFKDSHKNFVFNQKSTNSTLIDIEALHLDVTNEGHLLFKEIEKTLTDEIDRFNQDVVGTENEIKNEGIEYISKLLNNLVENENQGTEDLKTLIKVLASNPEKIEKEIESQL
jgi:hypothetical protein